MGTRVCAVGPASRQLFARCQEAVSQAHLSPPVECHLGLSAQSGPQFPGLQPGSKWGVTQTVRVLKAAFLKPSQRLVAAW